MERDHIYRHFCMTARALEVVGERWSLLIVRDLLLGPQRFTDLERSLPEITPTRLTQRLRRLEAAGVLARDSARTGREIWYRLTDAGRDLQPVIDALTLWGIEHARESPRTGERVPSEPVMTGTRVWLNAFGAPPPDGTVWAWRFHDGDGYTLRLEDGAWTLMRGIDRNASVIVAATEADWARFLTSPRDTRRLPTKEISLEGRKAQLSKFARAFRGELASG